MCACLVLVLSWWCWVCGGLVGIGGWMCSFFFFARTHNIGVRRCRFVSPSTLAATMASEADIISDAHSIADFLSAQQTVLPAITFDAIKQGQVNSLGAKILAMGSCGLAGATELTAAISGGPWTADQKAFLCSRITDPLTTAQATNAVPRKTQQCLTTSLPTYFTPSDYQFLNDSQHMLHAKMQRVCDRLCRVGLSCPSEATTRHLVAFLMIYALQDTTVSMSSQFAMVTETKTALKVCAKSHPFPFPHLQKFPTSPADLPPAVYQHCYEAEAPATITATSNLALVAAQVPMRNTHKGVRQTPNHVLQHQHHIAQMPEFLQTLMQAMATVMPGLTHHPHIAFVGRDVHSAAPSSVSSGHSSAASSSTPQKRARNSLALSDTQSASTADAPPDPFESPPAMAQDASDSLDSHNFHRSSSLLALMPPATTRPAMPPAYAAAAPLSVAQSLPAPGFAVDASQGGASPALAGSSVDDMHKAVHDAMQTRDAKKLETAAKCAMKRPAAAPTPEKKGSPKVPDLSGPSNPPPVVYGPGKIYTSLAKGAFRVLRRVGDRVDVTVRWKDDAATAWQEALGAIDNDDR